MLHKFWDKYLCNLPLDSGQKKWYNGMLMRIRPSASENRPAPCPINGTVPKMGQVIEVSQKWDNPKNGTHATRTKKVSH